MDLTASPDIAAYQCYAIVLIAGLITATQQIGKRLGTIQGHWFVWRTWLLFSLYALIPVALFWALDWTGAISDTSVFAAILIGFGYERILAGSDEKISAPGALSAVWSPLLTYADTVVKRILPTVARNQRRFEERVIQGILQDEARYKNLEQLALTRSSDVSALQQSLAEIDQNCTAGTETVRERRVRRLYEEICTLPDEQYLLMEKGITDAWSYYWFAREWRSKAVGIGVAVALVTSALAVNTLAEQEDSCLFAQYYLWRLQKDNATEKDLERTRQGLAQEIGNTERIQCVMNGMRNVLRNPSLSAERLDRAVQLLIEHRRQIATSEVDLAGMLGDSLRNQNVDARERIQSVLVFLAEDQNITPDAKVLGWNPSDGSSVPELEQFIDQWRRQFDASPTAAQ